MDQFKNKYRSNSTRLPNWDYGKNACYFITILTHNYNHFFGKIINGQMHLSEMGQMADELWKKIPEQFPYVKLHKHVIMQDHMHGIIEISKTGSITSPDAESLETHSVKTRYIASPVLPDTKSASHASSPASPTKGGITGNQNPMLQQNIPRIIRWYKGRCTFEIRKKHPHFKWHTKYYDRIIRNEKGFYNIEKYIEMNPSV